MPEQHDFSLCMLKNVRNAARAISRRYNAFIHHLGLTGAQFTVLILVRNNPGKTTSDLAATALLERTTLVRNLAVLERMELLKSQPLKKGIGKSHRLTPKGATLLEEALPLWEEAQADLKEKMGEDSFLDTIKALQALSKL
ncbi:winged helix-turn-helix transcriptional regulator [Roseibium sp. CAU 1637]|uniref:Winged helix-turn-helix transcriptional regulator n=2 Tax=Roseibium limicola TaxID=2816037 RepID=A0A939EN08_9HYPH|nr:winged helix-turn-helix transcriptional regulator [Roseibium limicola]